MIKNKTFIDETINLRMKKGDFLKEISLRNKASPLNVWFEFIPFSKKNYFKIFAPEIDGVKLKFKFATIYLNGRHSNN